MKIVTMDATWNSAFGSTWTWLATGFNSAIITEGAETINGLWLDFNTTYYGSYTTYDNLNVPYAYYSGANYTTAISGYGRTIATSGTHTIRMVIVYNFKTRTIQYTIYADGTSHKTGTITLNTNQINAAKASIGQGKYYLASFGRGFANVNNFLQKWKVTVED